MNAADGGASSARFWLILAALVVLLVIIIGGAGGDGPPYDPDSVQPDGARGIVEVLEELGADVAIRRSTPRENDTAVLMLRDRLLPDDTARLEAWVRAGGLLVVADRTSQLSPRGTPLGATSGPVITQGTCTIAALAEAQQLELSVSYRMSTDGNPSCFGDGANAFVVAEQFGAGTIVAVGGQELFTNATLDEADAAVVAVSLLAPQPNEARITFLGPSQAVTDDSLSGEVAPRVGSAILQLLAAFLLYALFRMRRLGGVVAEPVPVIIEGSELVLRAGVLSERAQDPASAADVLRDDFLSRARRSLGVPIDTTAGGPTDVVVQVIADQTDFETEAVYSALTSVVDTEGDLIAVAHQLDAIDVVLQQ